MDYLSPEFLSCLASSAGADSYCSLSLERYENAVVSGGLIITNSSLVEQKVVRTDVRVVPIPANEEAEQMGDLLVANNIILSALLELTGVVSIQTVAESPPRQTQLSIRHFFNKTL